jgi:hypothetical protein
MANRRVEDYAHAHGTSNNAAKRSLGLKHAVKKHVRVAAEKAAGGKRAAKLAKGK